MAAIRTRRPSELSALAEELTRRLGVPFVPGSHGTLTFSAKLRVTDWAVPLMFDGHVARDRDALVPKDFIGHALWPNLKATRPRGGDRPWWQCSLPAPVADAIVEALRDEDEHPLDEDVWQIGRDVLLEEDFVPAAARRRRRRVA